MEANHNLARMSRGRRACSLVAAQALTWFDHFASSSGYAVGVTLLQSIFYPEPSLIGIGLGGFSVQHEPLHLKPPPNPTTKTQRIEETLFDRGSKIKS